MKSNELDRRKFFQTGLAGAAAILASQDPASASQTAASVSKNADVIRKNPEDQPATDMFQEAARSIPLRRSDADVIVCGAGPAGVCAAIKAARSGAKVQLLEAHGSLGGVWTNGLLTFIFDMNKSKLGNEIIDRLNKLGAKRDQYDRDFVYEPEYMKFLLEEMCAEANVSYRLHTLAAAVHKTGRIIDTVITESKSGREAWQAPVIIDATGDGDIGALAGCGYEIGREGDGSEQPLTMNALAVVRDYTKMTKYISNIPVMWGPGGHTDSFRAFLSEIHRAGLEPSYYNPTLFQVHENLLMIMVNHEYNVHADDADALTRATVHSRSEIIKIVQALNKLGGVWEGMRVAATAEQIGIRSGRRIHGRYTLTAEDVAAGRRFDDNVTVSRFGIDIHAPSFHKNKEKTIEHGKFHPFGIPKRAMMAQDVDNLILAGRCISGDFIAHASYRVTGSAVAMGEAAGEIAARAARGKVYPFEIQWPIPEL